MPSLANIPFDILKVGDKASYQRTLTEQDLILFASVSGDFNPVHLDETFASKTKFQQRIAHGMWTGSLISAALAMKMPGPGGIYLGQTLKFLRPAKLGDTLTVNLEVIKKSDKNKTATISTTVVNQNNKIVVKGQAEVIPATKQIVVDQTTLPTITVDGCVN